MHVGHEPEADVSRDGHDHHEALPAAAPRLRSAGPPTIVDRMVDFHDWPTWRKSRLLMVAAAPLQVIGSAVVGLFADLSGIVDMPLFWSIYGAGVGVLLVSLAGVEMAGRRGGDGAWTVYLILVLWGLWLAVVIIALGVWSTGFFAWIPLITVLMGLWYDERLGWIILGGFLLTIATVTTLVLTGALPFAPLIQDRSFDAQNTIAFAGMILVGFSGFFGYTVLFTQLTVRTRMRQTELVKQQAERLDQTQRLIARYVPASVADHLSVGHAASAGFRPQRAKLTVFFSDVEGFTDAADRLDPEELATVLDSYFAEMAEVAEAHGASVNQFIGDAIMVFFGAPARGDDRDNAVRAVRMATGMQHRLVELRHEWTRQGIRAPFHARMGINTGYVSVGDFGSAGRTVYTAIGLQANIAARIQAHCPPDGIWIADTTYHLVRDDVPCADRGELTLKGVHFPVRVYEVLDDHPAPAQKPPAHSTEETT